MNAAQQQRYASIIDSRPLATRSRAESLRRRAMPTFVSSNAAPPIKQGAIMESVVHCDDCRRPMGQGALHIGDLLICADCYSVRREVTGFAHGQVVTKETGPRVVAEQRAKNTTPAHRRRVGAVVPLSERRERAGRLSNEGAARSLALLSVIRGDIAAMRVVLHDWQGQLATLDEWVATR